MNIECPHCNVQLNALPEHYGKVVECAACGSDITIQEPAPPASIKKPSKVTSKAKKEKAPDWFAICHYCKKEIDKDATRCNHCGSSLSSSSLSSILLGLFTIGSFLAGFGFFIDSTEIMSNAKGAIHEVYGAVVSLKACLCFATAFILLALSNYHKR